MVGSGCGSEWKRSGKTCLSLATLLAKPGQLSALEPQVLLSLPAPYDDLPPRKPLNQKVLDRIDTSLDGFSALGLVRPQTPQEEQEFVQRFVSGLEKAAEPR